MTIDATTTTSTSTTGHTGDVDGDVEVAVAATVAAIDTLITQYVTLAREGARLKDDLAQLAEAITAQEARLTLSPDVADGRNDAERRARLALALASDADLRRLKDAERDTRRHLAEAEARGWAVRQKVRTCLALLRLASAEE